MNVQKQMEAIHSMARGGLMRWLKWFSIVLSAILVALGIYTGQPPYLMFVIFPVLIAYSAHQTNPHILAASQAMRSSNKSEGLVKIEIESSTDSETFYAIVTAQSTREWRFEFIPLGWKPVAGQVPATLYTLGGRDWPALVEVAGGIMYPRYTPKQVSH